VCQTCLRSNEDRLGAREDTVNSWCTKRVGFAVSSLPVDSLEDDDSPHRIRNWDLESHDRGLDVDQASSVKVFEF
jgi:hypothetical protein